MSQVTDAPFVSEVLMYDRLVVPTPPSSGASVDFWADYEPERLLAYLDILGIKTPENDGLAFSVPWDDDKRSRFSTKMSSAAGVAEQNRSAKSTYYMDPFHMTRDLLRKDFRPALPHGVTKAMTVAAYPSAEGFRADQGELEIAAAVRHRFLTPAGPDPDGEKLKRAVDLAMSDDFRTKRARYHEWQEDMIAEKVQPQKAVEEMASRLKNYNDMIEDEMNGVQERFVYTVIPITAGLAGTVATGGAGGLPFVIACISGLVAMAQFARFGSARDIDAGDLDGSAMIHDARGTGLFGL